MIKKLRHLKSITLVVLLIVLLPSCKDDNQLAKDLDGYWNYYDDYNEVEVYLMLVNTNNSGGIFLETTTSTDFYYDYNDEAHWIPYCTAINGYWEIKDGRLCQDYDVYSLQVNAYESEVGAYLAKEFNEDKYEEVFGNYEIYEKILKVRDKVRVSKSTMSFIDAASRVKCSRIRSDEMPGFEFLKTE